jgi:hypothetical protein
MRLSSRTTSNAVDAKTAIARGYPLTIHRSVVGRRRPSASSLSLSQFLFLLPPPLPLLSLLFFPRGSSRRAQYQQVDR